MVFDLIKDSGSLGRFRFGRLDILHIVFVEDHVNDRANIFFADRAFEVGQADIFAEVILFFVKIQSDFGEFVEIFWLIMFIKPIDNDAFFLGFGVFDFLLPFEIGVFDVFDGFFLRQFGDFLFQSVMFFLELFWRDKPRFNLLAVDFRWLVGVDEDKVIREDFVEEHFSDGRDEIFVLHIAW